MNHKAVTKRRGQRLLTYCNTAQTSFLPTMSTKWEGGMFCDRFGKEGYRPQVTVSELKGLSKRSQIGFISLSLSCVLSWCCPRCSVAERKRPIIKHESLATLAVCLHVSKGTKSNWGCFLDQDTKDFTDDGGGGSNSRREFSCLGCDRRFASFQVCLKR